MRFVTVYYSAGIGGWDTHKDNFATLKNSRLPHTDRTLSALLDDLKDRGLLDETLVYWTGDFGRTPKVNKDAGRDHWPQCMSVLMAGGGIKGGKTYGASDPSGAFPKDDPVRPDDITATVFHALGYDPANRNPRSARSADPDLRRRTHHIVVRVTDTAATSTRLSLSRKDMNDSLRNETVLGAAVSKNVRSVLPNTVHSSQTSLLLATLLVALMPLSARAVEPVLVFSVKTWDGEYTSKDVPGGVESTPTKGAIYTVKADGTGLKQIVPFGERTDYPAASPDGRWVYFQSKKSGGTGVYRCKWDGTGVESLTSAERLTKELKDAKGFKVQESFGYVLSADGSTMVFTAYDGKSGRVVVAGSDGSSPRLIAPQLGYIYMARLSPTSDRVVFSGPAKGYRLLIAALPDGKPVELTPDHPECFVPQFTPDGKIVVFVRRDGDVYRVDADGKNFRRLTEGNKYVEFKLSPKDQHGSTDGPDISPDGKRVAFIALKGGVPNVSVVNIDGMSRKQITTRKTPCGRVRWSPDGKQLAFVSFEGKYPQLFVVSADGGEARQLTKLDGAVYFVNWIGTKPEK